MLPRATLSSAAVNAVVPSACAADTTTLVPEPSYEATAVFLVPPASRRPAVEPAVP